MIAHAALSDCEIHSFIRKNQFKWAGNEKLKIYGKLNCWSGKRMKRVNRVFFKDEEEALILGYRRCKHCNS